MRGLRIGGLVSQTCALHIYAVSLQNCHTTSNRGTKFLYPELPKITRLLPGDMSLNLWSEDWYEKQKINLQPLRELNPFFPLIFLNGRQHRKFWKIMYFSLFLVRLKLCNYRNQWKKFNSRIFREPNHFFGNFSKSKGLTKAVLWKNTYFSYSSYYLSNLAVH